MNSAAIAQLVAVMNGSESTELTAMPSPPAPVAPTPAPIFSAGASAVPASALAPAPVAPAPAPVVSASALAPAPVALAPAPVAPAVPASASVPTRVVLAPSSITSAPVPIWDRPAADAALAALARVPGAPAPIAAKSPPKSLAMAKASAQVVTRASAVESRRPYHLGVAIGLSAGVYASSLAVVSILQIQQDGQVAADRRPVGDAISMLGVHNDAMEADLQAARSVFDEASVRYGSVVSDIGELHVAVKQLGKTIVRIEGTSTDFRLPSMVSLPSVPQGTSNRPASAAKPGSASKPAAKPPPPSNGGTGASGKP